MTAPAAELRFPGPTPFVVEEVVSGIGQPVCSGDAPDGRLLIAERGAGIRAATPGRLRDAPALC